MVDDDPTLDPPEDLLVPIVVIVLTDLPEPCLGESCDIVVLVEVSGNSWSTLIPVPRVDKDDPVLDPPEDPEEDEIGLEEVRETVNCWCDGLICVFTFRARRPAIFLRIYEV